MKGDNSDGKFLDKLLITRADDSRRGKVSITVFLFIYMISQKNRCIGSLNLT